MADLRVVHVACCSELWQYLGWLLSSFDMAALTAASAASCGRAGAWSACDAALSSHCCALAAGVATATSHVAHVTYCSELWPVPGQPLSSTVTAALTAALAALGGRAETWSTSVAAASRRSAGDACLAAQHGVQAAYRPEPWLRLDWLSSFSTLSALSSLSALSPLPACSVAAILGSTRRPAAALLLAVRTASASPVRRWADEGDEDGEEYGEEDPDAEGDEDGEGYGEEGSDAEDDQYAASGAGPSGSDHRQLTSTRHRRDERPGAGTCYWSLYCPSFRLRHTAGGALRRKVAS